MALKAMIPETATTCRSRTISSARDSFMFGSDISSLSAWPEARSDRCAAVARSFLRVPNFGSFMILFRQSLHEDTKLIAAIGVAFKHVEGRCAWGKKNQFARPGEGVCALNRIGERARNFGFDRAAPGVRDAFRHFADEDGRTHFFFHEWPQRMQGEAFVFST